MKNKFLSLVVLLGLSFQAQATLVSFDPSDQSTTVGGSVSVDLVISDILINKTGNAW